MKLFDAVKTVAEHCKKTDCVCCCFKSMPHCPGEWMAKEVFNDYAYAQHVDDLVAVAKQCTMKG